MKRALFIAALVLAFASHAAAQGTTPVTLADVAKKEEERQKQVKKPSKVFTNSDLKPDTSKPSVPPSAAPSATAAANATPGNTTPGTPPASAEPAKDQAYWQGRMKTARDELNRARMFADALQSQINGLAAEFVNRDDPAQRAKIESDRKTALAELDRVRKEIDDKNKAITAIEEEARRSGVPAGWLRPPV